MNSGSDRSLPPSGEQYPIAYGDYRAEVTQVGAGLRECLFQGKHVVDGFAVGVRASDGRGQVLAPWPNRLSGGSYEFGGRTCQAPLNEPALGNAIHGLIRWLDWTPASHSPSAVSMTCTLRPQPGFEWQLEFEVTYELGEGGLKVSTQVVNHSQEPAPVGVGFHPYVTLGLPIEQLHMTLPASSYLSPAASSESASSKTPVTGTEFDFMDSRCLGQTSLDTAYTGLVRDADGRAVVELRDLVDNRAIRLWVDEHYPYLMVYTGDGVRDPARRRQAVAIEPMTCPPNALRSGVDVIRLESKETWRASWGLAVV